MHPSRAVLFIVLLIAAVSVTALPASLSDQGTGVTYNGTTLQNGNLTITIWDAATGGNLVFNKTYASAIRNGSWNILLNDSVLDLEFGKKYWKDYAINGTDLDFGGDERLSFYSSVGAVGTASNTTAIGPNATAVAPYAMALGPLSWAADTEAISIGYSSRVNGTASIAIGTNAFVNRSSSIAIGEDASATESSGVAVGSGAMVRAQDSVAVGNDASAFEPYTIAIGDTAEALGAYAISIGMSAQAYYESVAIGEHADADNFGTAVGYNADAGNYSAAFGSGASVFAWNGTALGLDARVLHNNSVALGRDATTTAENQLMIGNYSAPLNTVINGNLTAIGTIQAQYGLLIAPDAHPRSPPIEGMIYYNSTLHKMCYYNSTHWVTFDGTNMWCG